MPALAKCAPRQQLPRPCSGPRCAEAADLGFRLQAVIGSYIVDFLAPSVRLIVEVDGGYHARRARADERRDRILYRAGYRVTRFSALQVSHNLPDVIQAIVAIARAIEGPC